VRRLCLRNRQWPIGNRQLIRVSLPRLLQTVESLNGLFGVASDDETAKQARSDRPRLVLLSAVEQSSKRMNRKEPKEHKNASVTARRTRRSRNRITEDNRQAHSERWLKT